LKRFSFARFRARKGSLKANTPGLAPEGSQKNNIMAKKSQLARNVKRTRLVTRFADKRAALKEAGDYEGLQKLPKNASPVRIKNRCSITGRSRGYMRLFGLSRIQFREMARRGEIPGVKKSSW